MDPIKNKAASDNAIRQAKEMLEAPKFCFFDSYDEKPGRSLVVFLCWSSGSPTLPCTQLHTLDRDAGMQGNTLEVQAFSFCLARYGLRILKREREREIT